VKIRKGEKGEEVFIYRSRFHDEGGVGLGFIIKE
jgi:hypothetical protein